MKYQINPKGVIGNQRLTNIDWPGLGAMSITDPTTVTSPPKKTKEVDDQGFKLLASNIVTKSQWIKLDGGQVMHFRLENLNILGTTITITSNSPKDSKSIIIPPLSSANLTFDVFGNEPRGWVFNITTNSDAFIVRYKLFLSWVDGDPPNK